MYCSYEIFLEMKTNVHTSGIFLLSRDAPQTDQTDKIQYQIIHKPSIPFENSMTPTGEVKSENVVFTISI